jgi:hypothetical protein
VSREPKHDAILIRYRIREDETEALEKSVNGFLDRRTVRSQIELKTVQRVTLSNAIHHQDSASDDEYIPS